MNLLVEGGLSFTIPILLLALASVGMFVLSLVGKMNGKEVSKKRIDSVLFLGSVAFFAGILGQTIGLYSAAEAIQQADQIAPALIWGGIKVSLITTIMGFCTLIISLIMWFILKAKN